MQNFLRSLLLKQGNIYFVRSSLVSNCCYSYVNAKLCKETFASVLALFYL
jgi:hypothetical protein